MLTEVFNGLIFTTGVDQHIKASGGGLLKAGSDVGKGTEKPVFQGGQQVGVVREYSDVLLIFLLKGARPEKYRDNLKADVNHSGQVSLPDVVKVLEEMRNKEREET
ncbi:MAG: hypothetical protein Q8O86_09895 [Dehalococcoidia bacterium]|nr:hypothetical protein [Dehalococcoidia bacterium]